MFASGVETRGGTTDCNQVGKPCFELDSPLLIANNVANLARKLGGKLSGKSSFSNATGRSGTTVCNWWNNVFLNTG